MVSQGLNQLAARRINVAEKRWDWEEDYHNMYGKGIVPEYEQLHVPIVKPKLQKVCDKVVIYFVVTSIIASFAILFVCGCIKIYSWIMNGQW